MSRIVKGYLPGFPGDSSFSSLDPAVSSCMASVMVWRDHGLLLLGILQMLSRMLRPVERLAPSCKHLAGTRLELVDNRGQVARKVMATVRLKEKMTRQRSQVTSWVSRKCLSGIWRELFDLYGWNEWLAEEVCSHRAFLGEAFGPPQPHEADHPRNNPFAEGGHDEEPERAQPRRPGAHIHMNDPFAAFAAAAQAGQGPGAPLGSLVTLLNAIGLGPMPGARGDYAFNEASFQQILNDLMEQAQGRAGPQPAPPEMIEELPKHKIDQAFLDDAKVSTDCVICQDVFALGEEVTTLPCKHAHVFHSGEQLGGSDLQKR